MNIDLNIAPKKSHPMRNQEDAIISRYLPSYPNDNHLLTSSMLIDMGRDIVDYFNATYTKYDLDRMHNEKPCVRAEKFKEPMRKAMQRRYPNAVINDNTIYQVLWVVLVLLKLVCKKNWFETTLHDNLCTYLGMTAYFKRQHVYAQQAANAITKLTQPSLDLFDDEQQLAAPEVQPTMPKPTVNTMPKPTLHAMPKPEDASLLRWESVCPYWKNLVEQFKKNGDEQLNVHVNLTINTNYGPIIILNNSPIYDHSK